MFQWLCYAVTDCLFLSFVLLAIVVIKTTRLKRFVHSPTNGRSGTRDLRTRYRSARIDTEIPDSLRFTGGGNDRPSLGGLKTLAVGLGAVGSGWASHSMGTSSALALELPA